MSIDYVHEKLFSGISGMMTSNGSLGDRLIDAYVSQFIRITPDEDMPEDLRFSFEKITRKIISIKTDKLTDFDLREIVDEILVLFSDICYENKRIE